MKDVGAENNTPILKKMSGIANQDAAAQILATAIQAFPRNISQEQATSVVTNGIMEMAPKDPIEGMLCAQILTLDAQGMRYLARAENEGNLLCHMEAFVNLATKLLRLKNDTIETLNRYRRKGEQKMVIQHVHVNDDAKAIIGNNMKLQGGDYDEF